MKLIIAIVHDEDSGRLTEVFNKNKVRVTKLASTGGFLRSGNVTLMIGTEPENVDGIIDIIKDVCKSRTELVAPAASNFFSSMNWPYEVNVGGATVFVLDVDRYEKI